jgi:hypothetical protein
MAMSQQNSPDGNESVIAWLMRSVFGICVLVMFGSGPQRFPETAGHIAFWVMCAIVAIQFGREFLKGVADAGGWSGKR